ASFSIPEGIGFRIEPATVLMVQHHWINSSSQTIDGQAVFNVHALPPDPARQTAQLFTSYTINVSLPARAPAKVTTDCTIKNDLKIFSFGGHAHEWGTHVHIDRIRAGATEVIYDHDWNPSFQSAPPFATFDPKKPLEFHAGDVLHLECNYMNTTEEEIRFPREMCVAFGFYFPAAADIQCADGEWIAH